MSKENKTTSYPLPMAEPEEVGFSRERLAKIRPAMQKFIDREMIPNVNTLVARHGKIVYYDVQGYMDLVTKTPATRDTVYRLWSNSKPITGLATMICVEDGLLTLDDPVSKYIPSFKNQVVRVQQGGPMMPVLPPVERDITIRDCLRNTTGLTTMQKAPLSYMMQYGDIVQKAGLMMPPQNSGNMREQIDALARLPLETQPGTAFEYQVGYPIAGMVLMTVTGKTLEEFYQERIFKPLGMTKTSFYLERDRLKDFPTLYRPALADGKWALQVDEVPEKSPKVIGPRDFFEAGGGGGGVLSTTGDYARFAQMLLNGGRLDGVRIVSRKSVEVMTSSHTGNIELNIPGPGYGFGMGVGVYLGGGGTPIWRSIGTYGWGGAAGTTYFADPKEDLICCCFTQVFMHFSIPGCTFQEEFERLVYQALE